MKSSFAGYYPPTPEEYERLWRDALIVLDTNVLLNLYRLPSVAQDDFFKVLELLRDRIWIPHHVALEFQRRRLTVIAAERKLTEEALKSSSDLVSELRRQVDALQIDKRGLGIDSKPLLDELERANTALADAIRAVHKSQLEIASSDPVRERLDKILADRVGQGPQTQADLETLIDTGEERFRDRIPPGFADADKEKNPNEATFIHDRMNYLRKFGDLILWRQIIEHVKTSKVQVVLLVTADKKEDWWWREQGKTIGPQPALVREIRRDAAVELFWMYSSVQFVEHARKYAAATVSNESVAELQHVTLSAPASLEQLPQITRLSVDTINGSVERQSELSYERFDMRDIEGSVGSWLNRTHADVIANPHGFPDFVIRHGEDTHGYEVKYLRHFGQMLVSPVVVNGILRGYLETKEGRLSGFTMIIVIPDTDFFEIVKSNKIGELDRRLARLLRRYPISAILVGSVVGRDFELLTSCRVDAIPRFHDGIPDEP